MARSGMDTGWKVVVFACAGFAVAFGWLLCGRSDETPQSSVVQAEAPQTHELGSVAHLHGPKNGILPLAASASAWGEYVKASAADDPVGEQKLGEEGQVFTLGEGTQVKAIDLNTQDGIAYRVRILDGPMKDKDGWTSGEFLK